MDNNSKQCIFCGSDEDITKDHIPPKNLFPEPRPNDLFTVPCCSSCNGSFSKDDEYFRAILVSCQSVSNDENANAVNKKFLVSLKRPQAKGFRAEILKSLTYVDSVSQGGIYMGQRPVMQIDAKRLKKTLIRIAKGLFYRINNHCIPKGYSATITFAQGGLTPSGFEKQIGPYWELTQSIGNGIFKYTYAVCNNNPNAMAIIFSFYEKLFFYGVIAPADDIAKDNSISTPTG